MERVPQWSISYRNPKISFAALLAPGFSRSPTRPLKESQAIRVSDALGGIVALATRRHALVGSRRV
jgi:hypothetical protein